MTENGAAYFASDQISFNLEWWQNMLASIYRNSFH